MGSGEGETVAWSSSLSLVFFFCFDLSFVRPSYASPFRSLILVSVVTIFQDPTLLDHSQRFCFWARYEKMVERKKRNEPGPDFEEMDPTS